MSKYTTIRISKKVKDSLKRFAKKIGAKSLSQALKEAIKIAEKEYDHFSGNIELVLQSLNKSKDIGKTNAEKVDQYLYGE